MSSIISANKKAGHRRLAYQCLRCLHKYSITKVDARYRIIDHFMVKHVPLDEVPFFCRLCQLRATKKEELRLHTTRYPRHGAMLKEKGLLENEEFLVENNNAYKVTDKDVVALSPEESRKHWEDRAKPCGGRDLMQQAIVAALGEDFGGPLIYVDQPQPRPPAMATPQQPSQLLPLQPVVTTPVLQSPVPAVQLGPLQGIDLLTPLQQLVSALSGTAIPACTPTAPVAVPAGQQVGNMIQQTPTQINHQYHAEPEQDPVRAPSPVPSLTESTGVCANLPSVDECRALAPADKAVSESPSSSSSSSSSSESSSSSSSESAASAPASPPKTECDHHETILREIRQLKDQVNVLQDHFVRQYHGIHELATKLLQMAGTMGASTAKPPQPDKENQQERREDRRRVDFRESRRDRRYRPVHRDDRRRR